MVGLRYLTTKKRFSFVSIITIICLLGIIVGNMVMITVLSVVNGFQEDIRDKIIGMRSHINISSYSDKPLNQYDHVAFIASQNENIVSSYPYISLPAIMRSYGFTTLINVRSFDDKVFVDDIDFKRYFDFEKGNYSLENPHNALIGSEMAYIYALDIGSTIDVITAAGTFDSGFKPIKETFTVTGIYKTGYYEYDSKMVIVPLKTAELMAGFTNAVSGVSLKTKNFLEAQNIASEIDDALSGYYNVMPWTSFDRNFFQALHTEKLMLTLILSFIILIAALNIASSQIIFVKDKRRDIAILKTLGLSPSRIAKVFFLEGATIGFIGTFLGVIIGLLLAYNVNETLEFLRLVLQFFINMIWFLPKVTFGINTPIIPEIFPADVYYLTDGLPTIVHYGQVLLIALISFTLSVIFAIIPASIASKYKPAEVLRYE